MATPKSKWQYPVLLAAALALIVLLIVLSTLNKLQLPLSLYFLILLICDLAVTAFLTGWLKTTAEWNGTLMKGNLKLTGATVVFLLILGAGYKFRPVPSEEPFVFTITLYDPTNAHNNFSGDTLQLSSGNLLRTEPVNTSGQAIFLDISPNYRGQPVHLLARMDRFRIAGTPDTLITIPSTAAPSVRLPLFPLGDSILFGGLVLKRNQAKAPEPVAGAAIKFTGFDKVVRTDSLGQFSVYLLAKTGDVTAILVSRERKWIFSGEVPLSKNMQILADE